MRETIDLEDMDKATPKAKSIGNFSLKEFGMLLFRERAKKGMKIKDVAIACGTNPTTIKNIENGIGAPNPPTFDRIVEFYDIDLGEARKVLVRDKQAKVAMRYSLNAFEK